MLFEYCKALYEKKEFARAYELILACSADIHAAGFHGVILYSKIMRENGRYSEAMSLLESCTAADTGEDVLLKKEIGNLYRDWYGGLPGIEEIENRYEALVEDFERLKESAENLGYKFKYSDDESYIFKYPVDGQFGTKVSYRALGIGEYSSNLTYAFPQIQVGKFNSLDDYSIEELKKYDKDRF